MCAAAVASSCPVSCLTAVRGCDGIKCSPQSVTISLLTWQDMMPWQTFYSQCYYNAVGPGALDRMPASIYAHDAEHACVDDPVCSTGNFVNVFRAFGDVPCVGDGSSMTGWNSTVRAAIAGNDGPFGVKLTVAELDNKCSRSCLSREYCRNPLDLCHPWCQKIEKGFTDFFKFCLSDERSDTHASKFDFCEVDKSEQEKLIAEGMSHKEAEEEASSVCFSTFNDDIGTFEKFSEKANVQLQNLLITIEMFFAALAHRTVFSYRDFKTGTKKTMANGLRDMMPTEVLRDVQNLTTKQAKKRVKNLEYVGGQVGGLIEDAADVVVGTVRDVARA